MNGRVAKKVHKEAVKLAKANWFEYVNAICQWPFRARLRFAWHILFKAKKIKRNDRAILDDISGGPGKVDAMAL